MTTTIATRIEEAAVGASVILAIGVGSYLLYSIPDAAREVRDDLTALGSGRNISGTLSGVFHLVAQPVRLVWPHVHIPFLPFTYLLGVVYSILYPLIVVLQCIVYVLLAPLRIVYGLATLIYPLYVFFGVAALTGLAIGGGAGGIARLVWFLSDMDTETDTKG